MTPHSAVVRLVLGAAAALFLWPTAAPAFAAPVAPAHDGLSYSADGVNYFDSPPMIFANAPKLVPGDEIREKLWIRNERTGAVDVAVDVPNAGQIYDGIHMSATITAATGTLPAGADARIIFRAWLPVEAGNATQNLAATNLAVKVHVRDSVPNAPPDSDTEGAISGGGLVDTGATPGVWLLGLGALAVGGAAYGMSRRRTRMEARMEEDTVNDIEGVEP